jgi:mRNA interferase RelE/StbE
MTVRIDRSLEKDVKKIGDSTIKNSLVRVIVQIQKAEKISDLPNATKLHGYGNAFRIRIGDYRLGFIINVHHEVELIRFLHRKEIYSHFP